MWVFLYPFLFSSCFVFVFLTSLSKLSIFIIAVLTSLSAIPSFVPFLGLFLLTVFFFCLVISHTFLFLRMPGNFLLDICLVFYVFGSGFYCIALNIVGLCSGPVQLLGISLILLRSASEL